MENRNIAENLKPNFENVSREFITDTMYDILFDDKIPNFKFEFREDEAINFIEKIVQEYADKYDYFKEKAQRIIESIKKKSDGNETQPIMIINDYKEFFELLRKYYEKDIDLYFRRTDYSGLPVYEKKNCFEQIWLRATPEDFNNPEQFLKKQVDMISDNTFEKYNEETYLGALSKLDNHAICVQNGISRTWDETQKEFKITIYDKQHYDNTKLIYKPHYELPVIRYGIYEKDGKKICHIGSVQNKRVEENKDSNLAVNLNNVRAELNKGKLRKENYKNRVEPTKTFALSIFINFLNEEGITEIEVPNMYVLDHEFHEKRSKTLLENFNKEWTEERQIRSPGLYNQISDYVKNSYNKQDLISEIKTERLINCFERILYHYPKGKIKSYPGELDSFLHLSIPRIASKNDINGDILKDMYGLVEEKYSQQER